MVITCCVRGCRSENYPGCGMSFHVFPNQENLKERWIKAVQRENWKPSQHSRICSKHFKQDYFLEGKRRSTLHKNAVPTLNIICNTDTEKESLESRHYSSPDNLSIDDSNHVTIIERRKPIRNKQSKNPVVIIKSSSGISTLNGKIAKILLRQRAKSAKLLQQLLISQQMCRRLKNKVSLLEHEVKQLKSKNSTKGAPLMLTLSNDMYEKETLTIRVTRSE